MKKLNMIYFGAIILIASVINVESSFASATTNETTSVSSGTEKMYAMPSDSVIVTENNQSLEQLLRTTDTMNGVNLITYLRNNIKYPQKAIQEGSEGTIKVLCTVEKNGSISNAMTLEGKDSELSREVLRALRNVRLQPVIQNGFPTRYRLLIPVNFELTN
jgi:TonB family protein